MYCTLNMAAQFRAILFNLMVWCFISQPSNLALLDSTVTNPISDRPENPISDKRLKATNPLCDKGQKATNPITDDPP